MSQKLPTHGYKWMKEDLLTKKNVSKLLNLRGTNIGYIFEVDLEYPESKHDSHNDYPLAPEKMKVDNVEKLISHYLRLGKSYVNYVIKNLRKYLQIGLKTKKRT